jgi:hypothetical protein
MRLRRVISLFLLTGVLFLLVTSVILYVVPQGRVAYWSGWTLWGLSKTEWTNLHINLGLLLLIAAGFHVFYNWKPITSYMKSRSRRLVVFTGEFTVALAITAVILVLTQLGVPPLSWVLDLNESIKDAGSARHGEPPYGHAELSTLTTFTRRLELDLTESVARLEAAGYEVAGPKATLAEIAAANGVTPQMLYDAMRRPVGAAGVGAAGVGAAGVGAGGDVAAAATGFPKTPPPGTGKRQLAALCDEYGFAAQAAVAHLASHDIRATAEQTLQEIAAANGTTPDEVYEALRMIEGP